MANLSNINNKFLVTTGGNVGINVTSPTAARLVVNTTSGVTAAFGRDGTDGDVVQVYNGLAGTTKVIALSASGNDGTIYSQYGNIILQPTAGNVGIGTDSPSVQLEVKGSTYSLIRVNGANTNDAGIDFGDADDNDIGRIRYENTDDSMRIWTNNAERMRIKSDGDIGINVANPLFKLDIRDDVTPVVLQMKSSSTSGAGFYIDNDRAGSKKFGFLVGNVEAGMFNIKDEDAGINRFVINSSGNVGIGTANPIGSGLTVAASTNGKGVEIQPSSGSLQYVLAYDRTVGAGSYIPLAVSGSELQFQTGSGTERMRIDSSGNVGIGTASPSTKLEVVTAVGGDAIRLNFGQSADIFLGFNAANPRILLQDNSNVVTHNFQSNGDNYIVGSNVGIGVTSPQTKLQTNLTITGAYLAYLNGTSTTFDAQANIAVVHNSPSIGSATAAGLVLANNDKSDGAPSPIIAFSAKSASNTYNHTYAAIYGIRTASGADTNWTKGDIVLATGSGTGPNERMRIDSSGIVTITRSPFFPAASLSDITTLKIENKSQSFGGTAAGIQLNAGDGDTIGAIFSRADGNNNTQEALFIITDTDNPIIFGTNTGASTGVTGNERMRITSGGEIHIKNGTTTGGKILLSGTDNDLKIDGSRGQIQFSINGTNEAVLDVNQFYPHANNGLNLGTTSLRFNTVYASNGVNTSDETLKENIKECDLGIDFIDSLKPKSYKFKDLKEDNDAYGKKRYGLIAQDLLQTELKDSIFGEKDGEYGLSYNDLIAPMIKAIQELKAEIDELKK